MDLNKIATGMGILIGLYLLGKFGNTFDQLLSSGFRFIEHQTSVLQGNYPYQVYTPTATAPRLNIGDYLSPHPFG